MMYGSRPVSLLTVRPRYFPEEEWLSLLPLCLSVKVCDGASDNGDDPAPIVALGRSYLQPLTAWGYHYLSRYRPSGSKYKMAYATDEDSARAEAATAARACLRWKAEAYFCNAEHVAFGAWGAPPVADVSRTARVFYEVFRDAAPGVDLVWNGLGWESYQETGGKSRKGLTVETMALYSAYCPMLYKLGPDTAARRKSTAQTWRYSRAKADRWRIPFAPMVASGSVDKSGQSWCWHFDKGGQPGLLSLVAELQPHSVAFFYGAGSSRMLSSGNAQNAALRRLPPWLDVARREGRDGVYQGSASHPDWTAGIGGRP